MKQSVAKTNRLEYLDMVKGIGIMLVVLGHIVYTEQHIMVWIASCHMPLFFVVAGVLLAVKGGDIRDLKYEISRRIKSLIVPYLWFSLIDFILDIGNVLLGKIDSHTFVVNIISSVTFYGKSVLWFLVAMFLAQVYFLILKKKLADRWVVICVILIAAICYGCKIGLEVIYNSNVEKLLITSLVNFARTFVRAGIVLPFFAFGYYIWKFVNYKFVTFGGNDDNKSKAIQLLTGLLLLAINITCAMINWSVDTNNMILGNVALYYIGGFTGSFAIILLCKNLITLRPITYLGRNSLIIMAVHLDCYILWAGLKIGMIVYGIIQIAPLFVGLSTLITLVICIIPIEIINRFFPFVIGKKRQKATN